MNNRPYDDRYYDDEQQHADTHRRYNNFDNSDFNGSERRQRPPRGQRDSDWADDIATRADGRLYDRYDHRQPQRRRKSEPYHDNDPYDDDSQPMKPTKNFRQRHPVLMNLFYIIITASVLMWALMLFLDYWTFHGEERVVPDVKGQTYTVAAENVKLSGLRVQIADSVFDSYNQPGTVVEQAPVSSAKIKNGGTVYLTIVAFSPKLVTVPDYRNASARQARSMFEGLGIKEVREVTVESEYAGLVLGAKFNGLTLQPGTRIPVSAVVTIEVGSGYAELDDLGADIDSTAINSFIDDLDIE